MSVPRYFEYHLLPQVMYYVSYLDDLPGSFEYHLDERSVNKTQILTVSKNEKLFGNRVYLIGYRIVLSFLLIYVIPMSALVALNGSILAALWRATQGAAARDQSTRLTTGSPQGRDDHDAEAAGTSSRGVCSRHQLSNCSRTPISAPPYPLQDFKALYKCCIIIILLL